VRACVRACVCGCFCVKYGPVFSFTMFGQTYTYLVGSDAAALFYEATNENLNAEEVYRKWTAPVWGKGVIYDVPNAVCLGLTLFQDREAR